MERHSRARGDSADAEVHRGEASAVEAPDFFLFAEEEPPRKNRTSIKSMMRFFRQQGLMPRTMEDKVLCHILTRADCVNKQPDSVLCIQEKEIEGSFILLEGIAVAYGAFDKATVTLLESIDNSEQGGFQRLKGKALTHILGVKLKTFKGPSNFIEGINRGKTACYTCVCLTECYVLVISPDMYTDILEGMFQSSIVQHRLKVLTLSSVNACCGWSSSRLSQAANEMQLIQVSKREELCAQYDKFNSVFIVDKGEIMITERVLVSATSGTAQRQTQRKPNCDENVLYCEVSYATHGFIIGDIEAMKRSKTRLYGAAAQSNAEVYSMSVSAFNTFFMRSEDDCRSVERIKEVARQNLIVYEQMVASRILRFAKEYKEKKETVSPEQRLLKGCSPSSYLTERGSRTARRREDSSIENSGKSPQQNTLQRGSSMGTDAEGQRENYIKPELRRINTMGSLLPSAGASALGFPSLRTPSNDQSPKSSQLSPKASFFNGLENNNQGLTPSSKAGISESLVSLIESHKKKERPVIKAMSPYALSPSGKEESTSRKASLLHSTSASGLSFHFSKEKGEHDHSTADQQTSDSEGYENSAVKALLSRRAPRYRAESQPVRSTNSLLKEQGLENPSQSLSGVAAPSLKKRQSQLLATEQSLKLNHENADEGRMVEERTRPPLSPSKLALTRTPSFKVNLLNTSRKARPHSYSKAESNVDEDIELSGKREIINTAGNEAKDNSAASSTRNRQSVRLSAAALVSLSDVRPAQLDIPVSVSDARPAQIDIPVSVSDARPAQIDTPVSVSDARPAQIDIPETVENENTASSGSNKPSHITFSNLAQELKRPSEALVPTLNLQKQTGTEDPSALFVLTITIDGEIFQIPYYGDKTPMATAQQFILVNGLQSDPNKDVYTEAVRREIATHLIQLKGTARSPLTARQRPRLQSARNFGQEPKERMQSARNLGHESKERITLLKSPNSRPIIVSNTLAGGFLQLKQTQTSGEICPLTARPTSRMASNTYSGPKLPGVSEKAR